MAPHLDVEGLHSAAQCSLAQSEAVMLLVLLAVTSELLEYEADPAAVILKPTMTRPGRRSGRRASAAESAEATVRSLAGVPLTLACVAFAGDSQRPERATEILAAMQSVPHIWPLTFAFGRARLGPRWPPGAGLPVGGQRASGRWATGSR